MTPSIDDFIGRWIDESGRVLIIERRDQDAVVVTVLCAETNAPYRRSLLLGRGTTKDLVAELTDTRLVVEAGTVHLGPTLQLEREGELLAPTVAMGLYDDFDDDLGAPWAFPLSHYRRLQEE